LASKYELYYTPASIINGAIYTKKHSYDEFFYFVSFLIDNYKNQTMKEEQFMEV